MLYCQHKNKLALDWFDRNMLSNSKLVMKAMLINILYISLLSEKCALPGLLSYPYRTITNNRAYWQCYLGMSRGMCCPEGFIYKQYQGCEEYDGPTDPCPPTIHHEGSCDSRPILDDQGWYEQYAPGHGWIKMPCAPGTHYNPADCQCSFHTSFIPGHKGLYFHIFVL